MAAAQQPARDRRAQIQARLSQLSSSSITAQKQHQLLLGTKFTDLIPAGLRKKMLPAQEQASTPTVTSSETVKTPPTVPVSFPQLQQQEGQQLPPATTQLMTQPLLGLQRTVMAELRATAQPGSTLDQQQLRSLAQPQLAMASSSSSSAGVHVNPQQLLAQQQQLVSQQQAIFNRLQQAQRGTMIAQAQAALARPQQAASLTPVQQRQLLAIQQSQVATQQALQQRAQAQAQASQSQAQASQQPQQQQQEASGARLKISVSSVR